MLYTNLNHIVNAGEFDQIIGENENVMVICGRMDALSIPMYRIAEELEEEYKSVKFYDLEIDDPNLYFLHLFPEVEQLEEIPYLLYFRNEKVVRATAGVQTKEQVSYILENEFSITVNS